jgi:hypothetical protein
VIGLIIVIGGMAGAVRAEQKMARQGLHINRKTDLFFFPSPLRGYAYAKRILPP